MRCADLPEPLLGAVEEVGGGRYTVSITTPAPIEARVTCVWVASGEEPLVSSAGLPLP